MPVIQLIDFIVKTDSSYFGSVMFFIHFIYAYIMLILNNSGLCVCIYVFINVSS